jgi:phage recombination protein Bet
MTTDQAASAALAIREGQNEWTPAQLAAFRQLGMGDAPDEDLAVFLHRCQVTGLDPFARQIRLRKDRQKVDGEWQDKWSIETEIDGYRVIASRAAKRDGVDLSYGPTYWYDAAGNKSELWLGAGTPAGASVTVYKDGRPFPGAVRFDSFASKNQQGQLMAQWARMPDHMIAKCAEAQALRKAFPLDLDGIEAADEAAHIAPQITVTQVSDPAPERRERPRPDNTAALRQAIRAEFDRIGLEDHEERGVYVNRLANKPADAPLTDLTASDLRFVLDSLRYDPEKGEGCEDLAALIDLCAVEAS